jgi:hypothetical protein
MESLTQLGFGDDCGEAIPGEKVGRKALVWVPSWERYPIWIFSSPSAAR